jgi:competence protein ComEC
LQIDAGGLRLLLPGDIEAARERELIRYWGQNLRSQWLLAGHHGSLTSTSNAWLKYVQPDTVVISSGHGNRFGHPHPAVMGRLDRDGAASAETSRWGALEFEFAPGRETVIRRYRADTRRFWM